MNLLVSIPSCSLSRSLNPEHNDLATPTRGARLHALTLSHLNCGFIIHGSGSHPFFNLSSHGKEGLFNIRGILG